MDSIINVDKKRDTFIGVGIKLDIGRFYKL